MTVTRQKRLDLCIFVAIVILIVWTGRRRLRVYHQAPPAVVDSPR